MNRPIRRVGLAVVGLMLILVFQLTYLQVVDAKKLAHDPRNSREALSDFTRPRGSILSSDGKILARSVPSNDEYENQRVYPFGELFAQTVGYQSVVVGSAGVEKSYNGALTGRDFRGLGFKDIGDLLLNKNHVANVVLSLRTDVQNVAKQALGNQRGSVVVMEPSTGSILAMYSNPSFDPNPLASHKVRDVNSYFNLLTSAPTNPMLPRAYRERFPPGSTFKIVTTEASLDTSTATPSTPFPVVTSFTPPQAGRAIQNFGGDRCGGTLEESFVKSCNVTFAKLGVAMGDKFPPQMAGFGLYDAPPLDLAPGAVVSTGPVPGSFTNDQPTFALAGIGQGQVATTPLQMAMVAGAVANGGTVMTPHVGAEIRDDEGKTLRTVAPEPWKRAMPATTAATIRDFMVQVVQNGTGKAAAIAGVSVAGKTGTAQTCDGCAPHAWFVAFAPADAPQFAVAVIVEKGGSLQDEATGGKVAAPVAASILRFLLGK